MRVYNKCLLFILVFLLPIMLFSKDNSLTQKERLFTLKGVNGEELELKRTKDGFTLLNDEDKVLILDFFATYCAPCKKEATNLTKLQSKYLKDVKLVGLIIFEDISNKNIIDNFVNEYFAFYFISNTPNQSKEIADLVLKDIGYKDTFLIPFKVVLKNGKYQTLTNIYAQDKRDGKFYIGEVPTNVVEEDLSKIIK